MQVQPPPSLSESCRLSARRCEAHFFADLDATIDLPKNLKFRVVGRKITAHGFAAEDRGQRPRAGRGAGKAADRKGVVGDGLWSARAEGHLAEKTELPFDTLAAACRDLIDHALDEDTGVSAGAPR